MCDNAVFEAFILDEELDAMGILSRSIDVIRNSSKNSSSANETMRCFIDTLQVHPKQAHAINEHIQTWLLKSKIAINLSSFGMLTKNSLFSELKERFYNKFLPAAPKNEEFRYIFSVLFDQKRDYQWVESIDDDVWLEFFALLLSSQTKQEKSKKYLFEELLFALEILSIWIASKEFDESLVRIDERLLDKASAFSALHREISTLTHSIAYEKAIDIKKTKTDMEHIDVILKQCQEQLERLQKASVTQGISLSTTYEFERIQRIIMRIESLFKLLTQFDTKPFYLSLVHMFKEVVKNNASRNSIRALLQQGGKIVARSIASNTSAQGTHYIVQNSKEYLQMFLSAAGAGVIIAFMAANKVYLGSLDVSVEFSTLLKSLNYGIGFVVIHLLGFTVATKQPAMTASTFAKAVEKGKNNKANAQKLVHLMFSVSRSQFAAILGNVVLAFSIGVAIMWGYFFMSGYVFDAHQIAYYKESLHPFSALFYAAIAGIWLFVSGLIAGYFDNRANLLDLKGRITYHPLLSKITTQKRREAIANYMHEHHGAIAGNFFFGVLLGITPYLGYLLNLPLDIRHVAFSAANFGFISSSMPFEWGEFLLLLLFVLLIGMVNLVVSFSLALWISLKSRDAYLGNVAHFLKVFAVEFWRAPLSVLFAPKVEDEAKTKSGRNEDK